MASRSRKSGLSCGGLTVASGLIPASHVAVYYWVWGLRGLVGEVKPQFRRCPAVDETKLKLNGQHLYVWAVIDVDSREILAVDVSWRRSITAAEQP